MNLLYFGVGIEGFCTDMKSVILIAGYVLLLLKIIIPLLIIGYGVFDFGKAVVAQKEDEIKAKTKRLVLRVVAGIAIFLLPNIILWIFKAFVDDYKTQAESGEFETCETCFLHPTQCNS